MEIREIDAYLDGGTIEIITDIGVFCFDNRIRSTTKGLLYNGYPKDDNSNIIIDSKELENELLLSLEDYKDDLYKTQITKLINLNKNYD